MGPKRARGRLQDTPRRPQEAPKRPQEADKRPPGGLGGLIVVLLLKKLEAPTNPVREENRTTVGNSNADYQHELIMNALHAIALLCFAWQFVGLLFYVLAMI